MKMNRNVNKYIKDCKHFFPFLSKNEKIFLKRLKVNIVENIDSTNIMIYVINLVILLILLFHILKIKTLII